MEIQDISATIRDVARQISETPQRQYIGTKINVHKALEHLRIALFPSYNGKDFDICRGCRDSERCMDNDDSERRMIALEHAADALIAAMRTVEPLKDACDHTERLIKDIPGILRLLKTDMQAAYDGDPAALSVDEVILAYPAFTAISTYRIAHDLYMMDVPVIPRVMTEHAHQLTGIDIHPGATIGPYFFIDHGTGVVIGETSTIGDHVKIYQNVTLGAKSFPIGPDGNPVKGVKRHPDVGSGVVIYAGATILGGDTSIGENSVIGGNVWLTHSVPANSKVTI